LRGAGHKIDDGGHGRKISGEVLSFWVKTNTTPLYWDVISDINIRLKIDPLQPGKDAVIQSYSCSNKERTYAWPTKKLVTKVLDGCLEELMRSLRSDPVWAGR